MKSFKLIICLFCFYSSMLIGQDCKYITNKEDKFTKSVIQETEPVELCTIIKNDGMAKIKDIGMKLRHEGDKRFFTLVYSISGNGAVPMFVGNGQSKLIILLDNDSTVELNMPGMMSDNKAAGFKNAVSTHFEISGDNYTKLLANNITDIRAVTLINPFDFKVKEGVKTSTFFSCIK